MSDWKNYITPRGLKRLRDEQRWLRLVERPKIVDAVADAAAMGDRSENAEYIYGKKRLREIDRRLRWLDKRIRAAEVVDPSTDRGDRVFFGATVVIGYEDGREREVTLVGEDEIEAGRGLISWRSPLGRQLMRKREGDRAKMNHLGETTTIELLEVDYREQEPDPPSAWDKAKGGIEIA